MNDALIKSQLQEALIRAGGTHDLEAHVIPMLRAGRAQWWDKGDGAIVTELRDYPNFSAVNYWLVAGNMRDCLAMQPDIDAWARGQNATRAMAIGRRGWERILPAHGWKPIGTAFGRDLRS